MEGRIKYRLAIGLAPILAFAGTGGAAARANGLKLIMTLESAALTYPFPARATLHLLNGGSKPVWLYHKARNGPEEKSSEAAAPGGLVFENHRIEGPTLAIRLTSPQGAGAERGAGYLLETVGLAHPKLVRLAPGEEYTEMALIRLTPATEEKDGRQPIWGHYKLSANYRAKYSNADEIERIVGIELWQGELESGALDIEIGPPTGTGSISGTALGTDRASLTNAVASLADGRERLIGQVRADLDGRFSFSNLPFGSYWVTVARANETTESAVFHRYQLTAESPAASDEFVVTTPEAYEPKQLLHEPVVFRVTDPAGQPLPNVSLKATWSSGTVMDSVRGQTDAEGLATMDLLPGPNFLTLKRKGCPAEDQRAVVNDKLALDGFTLVAECSKK